ncbi:MAG: oxidoreductase [Bacteroides sp. SM23_62_1]|nr:MAG: oxidoreductase [Bacteroides sp. SM23_62_1]
MRPRINFGIIGLGLMGKEFASAISRWCHLLDEAPIPVLKGICDTNKSSWNWYTDNFPEIIISTSDYNEILESDEIDAVYCAIPHHLHEGIYIDTIRSKKHLLGEKPFGIDKKANENILQVARANPDIIVRCSSQFPYFPACQRLIKWLREGRYGRIIEVRAGFHHASDMDLSKPINWKRIIKFNGEYGCMGDLGMHTLHIPLRMNWKPQNVFAVLQKIVETRPDGKGGTVPCETWDNAMITCKSIDPSTGKEFTLILETKRMAPGATNNWFIEIYGTEGSAIFNTHNPKAFKFLQTTGTEQGWNTIDTGSQSAIPTITGGIFEFGFSDAILQMVGAYMQEFNINGSNHPFKNVMLEETYQSHCIMTAALESHKTGKRIDISTA